MYILGIDAGTEAIKAGIFDTTGNLIAAESRSYSTHFPHPGWAEQDPLGWWSGLVRAVQECLAKSDINPADIGAVCADATTCTLVPIRANGQHLRRALLWMDVRATSQAARIFATQHPALRYSLTGVSAEWMPAKALWLKENEPDIYNQCDYLLEYTDWIAYKLTGRIALNLNTVTQRWFYHLPSGGWPIEFYEQIGLGDIFTKLPKDVLPIGAEVGKLSRDAALQLGLPAGIPVAMGGGDAFIALLGLGVVAPGDLSVVMGSSNVLSGLAREEVHFPGIFGSFPDAVLPGLNLVEGGQVSTGSILNWFKRNFAGDLAEHAKRTGTSIYTLLDDEAEKIRVGSDGLIVLDYFQGNRTPHTDSMARGVIMGLSLQASRAHVFRAIMEGIAYGTKDILDTFTRHQCEVSQIIACGGATHSRLFMQIYADVIGKPISVTRVAEASLLGAGVAAAYCANVYGSLAEASRSMTQVVDEYRPDPERHQQYQFYLAKYQETYQQLKHVMHDVTQHLS